MAGTGSPDYPQGDGVSTCPKCWGRGVVVVPPEERPPLAVGTVTRPCICVLVRDLLINADRGWRGLAKAQPLQTPSPLEGNETQNLWVTAHPANDALRRHLRHVAVRQRPSWFFLVAADTDLMDAWLSYDIPDEEIIDPDVSEQRIKRKTFRSNFAALVDLVEPPELLIIRLGVKAARNSAMNEVFREAVLYREHIGKPVWVVDQSDNLFAPGHICFSEAVRVVMAQWEHLTLKAKPFKAGKPATPESPPTPGGPSPDPNPTLDGPEPDEGGTLAEAVAGVSSEPAAPARPLFSENELGMGKKGKKKGGRR